MTQQFIKEQNHTDLIRMKNNTFVNEISWKEIIYTYMTYTYKYALYIV